MWIARVSVVSVVSMGLRGVSREPFSAFHGYSRGDCGILLGFLWMVSNSYFPSVSCFQMVSVREWFKICFWEF